MLFRSSFGGYNYPTADDILDMLKPFLAKHNCIVVSSEVSHEHERFVSPNDKDFYYFTDSVVIASIINVEDKEDYISASSHGAGLNKNSDKTTKAETLAWRYALMRLLNIKRINHEDTDNPAFDVKKDNAFMGDAAKSFKNRQRKTRSVEDKRNSSSLLM